MQHLIQCRINQLFKAKDDLETQFDKFHEIVLLVDKPTYLYTNEGSVLRERSVEELRFIVSDKNFDLFIEQLQANRNAKSSELNQ